MNNYIPHRFTLKSVLIAGLLGALAAPVAAKDLSIAIPGTNMHAWTSMGECNAHYTSSSQVCVELTGVCNNTVYTTQGIRHELVAAIRDKGATATVRVMNGGLFPKGSFGAVWCTISVQ